MNKSVLITHEAKDGVERKLLISEDSVWYSGLAKDFQKPKLKEVNDERIN